MNNIQIGLEVITDKTQTLPNAKRGDSHVGVVVTTQEQSDADLNWWPCSFCGRRVLVNVYGRGEKCACGAKRFNRKNGEGWRRGLKEWWFC